MIMLSFGAEFPNEADILEEVDNDVDGLMKNMATAIQRKMRKQRTKWPVDTGHSRRKFFVTYNKRTKAMTVRNTAPYAKYVNDTERYRKSEKRNPNFQAAQRSVEQIWDQILVDTDF